MGRPDRARSRGKRVKRGEVWWAQVDERCPVVLLSQDGADKVRAIVVVAPASTSIDGHAVEVKVGAGEGLPLEGVVRVALPRPGRIKCSWLVTLSQTDLLERLGALSSAKLSQLNDVLRRAGPE
jgi:mRNA interferase MazF